MGTKIRFGWQVTSRASQPLFDRFSNSPLFVANEPETYHNRISSQEQPLYHPIEFSPTNLFHLRLRNALREQFSLQIREKNFPYSATLPLFGPTRFGGSVQLFLPDIFSVRIFCHDDQTLDTSIAFKQRQFDRQKVLKFVASFLVEQILGELHISKDHKILHVAPIIRLTTDHEGEVFLPEHRTFLAALLINDQNFTHTDPKVFDGIYSRNEAHNRKGTGARQILINKQGVLSVITRSTVSYRAVKQEIVQRENLFTLGSALRDFYQTYPRDRLTHMREMDYLFFATKPYVKQPDLTFQLSVGNILAWKLILESFHLIDAFAAQQRFNVDQASPISALFDKLPSQGYLLSNFWEEVRRTLGENYMVNDTTNYNLTIQNNHGPVAAGPGATANSVGLTVDQRQDALKLVDDLAQKRPEAMSAEQNSSYDKIVSELRAEVGKDKPDATILRRSLDSLRAIAEAAAGGVIATTLAATLGKLLGIG